MAAAGLLQLAHSPLEYTLVETRLAEGTILHVKSSAVAIIVAQADGTAPLPARPETRAAQALGVVNLQQETAREDRVQLGGN